MNQLLLDNQIYKKDDSDNEDLNEEDLNNYKGYFHNEDEPEERYFEYGAHFPYKTLCNKLEKLLRTISPSQREISPSKVNNQEQHFRKINDIRPKQNMNRNNVFKKISCVTKNIKLNPPLNVTENLSLLKNKSRNQDINAMNNSGQTPNLKNTLSKKLTYNNMKKMEEKPTLNIYTSFTHDTVSKINNFSNKFKTDKLTFEKTNPVLVLEKNKKIITNPQTAKSKPDKTVLKNVITTYNSKLKTAEYSSNKIKNDIKKLSSLDKLQNSHTKIEGYRYITSSLDNRESYDLGLKIINNKNSNSSKVVISQVKNDDKTQMSDNNISNNLLQNPTKSFEIGNMLESLNLNTKSRNAQRDNLINAKSSLFNSDKVISQQSNSYNNKNQMYTHIVKNISLAKTLKIAPKSGKNKLNIIKKNSNSVIKKDLTNSIVKSIQIETEATQIQKSNFNTFISKNLSILKNNPSNKDICSQPTKIQVFNKIDTSQMKTKSNSTTSNLSSCVNNSNNSNKTIGLKTLNKISNVSFKKNDAPSMIVSISIDKKPCCN